MSVDLKEFLNNNIIGNVRSGTKGENDRPIKLHYFDVHIDKSTSSLAVELFNQLYNKPTKLKIKFISQNPIEVYLERYEGRRRKCFGNNKNAVLMGDNGKQETIQCNAKECPYKNNKECKYKARLYFLIEGLEDEGVWCYPLGSEKGIKKICRRILRANRLNEDLTKEWYELYLQEEDAPTKGKNYIPDIRKIEINDSKKEEKPEYLKLVSFAMTIFDNQKVVKLKFINTKAQTVELILMPNANQEVLNLKPESIILPLKVQKTQKGTLLNEYKVIKAISGEIENKKAV